MVHCSTLRCPVPVPVKTGTVCVPAPPGVFLPVPGTDSTGKKSSQVKSSQDIVGMSVMVLGDEHDVLMSDMGAEVEAPSCDVELQREATPHTDHSSHTEHSVWGYGLTGSASLDYEFCGQ